MSATTTTTPPPAQTASTNPEPTWAKPGVSIYALTIFLIAFVVCYYAKDSSSLQLMIGATITMATQVVSYYLGSSSGSAQKTALMSAPPPAGTTTTTTTPAAPPAAGAAGGAA